MNVPYIPRAMCSASGATMLARDIMTTDVCTLTPETRHLLNADRLALLKPSAYLINVARGPLVVTDAGVRAAGVLPERVRS